MTEPTTTQASTTEGPATNGGGATQVTIGQNQVLDHLRFYKSFADHDPARLEAYIEMAQADVATYRDPFDKAIATAFHLVLEEHLDPWSLDLLEFSRTYMERIEEVGEVDLITGGRLLSLAWTVLLAQSDELLARAQPPEPEPEMDPWDLPWDDFPQDWGEPVEDEPRQYTQRVLSDPEPPITESVFHQGDRRVTLYELVEALEEAREEAEVRQRLAEERRKAKREAKSQGKQNVKKIHKEDLEAEIRDVRERLQRIRGQVSLSAVHDGSREDFLTAFVSCLFLHRANMAELAQENFPFGPLLVEPLPAIHDPDAPLVGLPKKGGPAKQTQLPDEDDDDDADTADDRAAPTSPSAA